VEFGAPLGGMTPFDLCDGTTFQIGQPPDRIDVIQQIEGSRSMRLGPIALKALLMEKFKPA
jgi:hypothetical protein